MERPARRSRPAVLRLLLAAALAAGSVLVPTSALAAWNGLAAGVGYTAEGNTYSLTIADLNRDGAPDIVAASESTGHVLVYLGRGDGTFTAPSRVNVTSPFSLATGDLNGDGLPDLVVADALDATVSVLLGHGDGSFSSPASFAVGSGGSHSPGTSVANAVAIADLDGDGRLDIAVATVDGLGVLLGHGDGTFGAQSLHTATGSTCGVALADLNGDGRPDILAAVSGGFDVLLNAGGAGFSAPATFSASGATCSIVTGDLNGDSKRDVVVGTSVLLGVGDGSFGAATTYPVAHGVDAGDAVADLDGDGIPDLAFAEGNSSFVAVRRGKGDGTFLAAQEFGIGTGINNLPLSIAVGDLDGDGLPDAVTGGTGGGGPSAEVSVLLNAGPAPAQAPPGMTFTPNARADIHEGDNNQNEPQVAVDQTGTAYVTWQSNTPAPAQPPGLSSTTDGVTFTALPNPDPNGVNPINGDVDVATTTWPNLVHTPTVSGSGDNGVFAGKLAQGSCGAVEIRDATSRTQGATWTPADASCAPAQVDRPWIAAYTPPCTMPIGWHTPGTTGRRAVRTPTSTSSSSSSPTCASNVSSYGRRQRSGWLGTLVTRAMLRAVRGDGGLTWGREPGRATTRSPR